MPQDSAAQVLYVEDDRINIVLMEEVFRRLPGWELICAETGAEAMDLLHEGLRPDLLLIDMNLPDTNGMDLFARLQADPRLADLRCTALSADDDRRQVDAALAAGFCDYWIKPIAVPRFAAQLHACVALQTV